AVPVAVQVTVVVETERVAARVAVRERVVRGDARAAMQRLVDVAHEVKQPGEGDGSGSIGGARIDERRTQRNDALHGVERIGGGTVAGGVPQRGGRQREQGGGKEGGAAHTGRNNSATESTSGATAPVGSHWTRSRSTLGRATSGVHTSTKCSSGSTTQ